MFMTSWQLPFFHDRWPTWRAVRWKAKAVHSMQTKRHWLSFTKLCAPHFVPGLRIQHPILSFLRRICVKNRSSLQILIAVLPEWPRHQEQEYYTTDIVIGQLRCQLQYPLRLFAPHFSRPIHKTCLVSSYSTLRFSFIVVMIWEDSVGNNWHYP